jgi:predicted transcriptional regulator
MPSKVVEIMILDSLLVSEDAERVLLFLAARKKSYPSEIAGFYDRNIYGIQKQLEKFEEGGLLISGKVGRTRVYEFNPRYPLLNEFMLLLEKALRFLPAEEGERLLIFRRRPRRKGKPL